MKIKEVIVVEGKADTVAVKRATHADTIETNGSAINESILQQIQHAEKTRGVIVFTDPDYPGRRIRAIIEEHIPTVKHAFLNKKETISKNGKNIGIEHASDEAIRKAIHAVYSVDDEEVREIPIATLMEEGFIGHPQARKRRERLSEILHLGHVNGKGLKKRLEMFRITERQLKEAIDLIKKEEMDG